MRATLQHLMLSKSTYISMATFWLVTWALPWNTIGHWPFAIHAANKISTIIPSINAWPTQLHFTSAPALRALLTFCHLCGLTFILFALISSRPIRNIHASKLKLINAIIYALVFSCFFLGLLFFATTFNHPPTYTFSYYPNTIFCLILFYYLLSTHISMFVTFTLSIPYTSSQQEQNQ